MSPDGFHRRPERLALARANNLGHAEFLELIFADEVDRRDRTSAGLRARAAHLDPTMVLDAWDDTARPLATNWATTPSTSSGPASHDGTANRAKNRSSTPVAFSMNTELKPLAVHDATNASMHAASKCSGSRGLAVGTTAPATTFKSALATSTPSSCHRIESGT